jgi:hypothetical protein
MYYIFTNLSDTLLDNEVVSANILEIANRKWLANLTYSQLFDWQCIINNFQVHNVSFAFELMLDAGLGKPKARPEGMYSIDLGQ